MLFVAFGEVGDPNVLLITVFGYFKLHRICRTFIAIQILAEKSEEKSPGGKT